MRSLNEESTLGRVHWPLLATLLAIAGLGVWNLASAAQSDSPKLWMVQLAWILLGGLAVAISLLFDYRLLRTLAWPIYLLTVVMLILVPLKGRVIMGAQRWLELGPIRLQPSEFAKLAVVLVLARFFDDHPPEERVKRSVPFFGALWGWIRRMWQAWMARMEGALAPPPARRPRAVARRLTGYQLLDLWFPFLLLAIPAGLIMKQPDLGTALVTAAVGGSVIIFAGLTGGTLSFLLVSGIASTGLAWNFLLKPYQKSRVINFLDPASDVLGAGYHAMQSLIAVGSGGMRGKGWGNGTQNQLLFLPEQHTDFVFPVFAEEQGFVGAVVVVFLYLFLVLCALDIAARARDRFGAFIACGAAALFFWHAFINIGMVLGMLPIVGVPLLLFSYGGSNAVLSLLAVGVLLNVSLRRGQR